MFATFPKTPEEYFKATTSYLSQLPKNEKDVKKALEKVKAVFATETENSKAMWATFAKSARGDATLNEITAANKQAQELMVSARFAMLLATPGAVLMLPSIVEFAKQHNVDLVPASVAREFNI